MKALSLDLDGPVHVVDHGGRGRAMLLVHGLGGSHANWGSVASAFAEDFHVFAVDLPGFGLTELHGRAASIAANSRVLGRVIEAISDEPAVVVGNSMGGLLSLGAAVQQPRAFAALVLVDPALPVAPGSALRLDAAAVSFLLAYAIPGLGAWRLRRMASRGGPETLVRDMLKLCTVDFSRLEPALIEANIEVERRRMQRPGWDAPFFEASRSIVNLLAVRPRVERWVRSVSVPTLMLHGREDRVIPVASARAAAALRPDWEYCELDDVGHVPMMERPREFLDVTRDWLRRTLDAQPVSGGQGKRLRAVGA